jgi:membrane protein DedA with SNARE-associated domain
VKVFGRRETTMLHHVPLALLLATPTARRVSHWFIQLGGIGLIPLGLLDGSVIPVPGSVDVVTIVLAAHDGALWPYYAIMATIGSVVGAYLTFRLARRHGADRLAKRVSKAKLKRFQYLIQRWGFGAIAVPALLPPPMPMVPFVIAAGASNYSWRNFLAALSLGRAIRYVVLAYLGARYGRHIVRVFSEDGMRILYVTIALVAGTVIFELIRRFVGKPQRES